VSPLGGGGFVGTPPFTIVGADAACVSISPSTSGSNSSASFTFTLNATQPVAIGLGVYDQGNGNLTVPNGTTYSATAASGSISVTSSSVSVRDVSTPSPTLINLPVGDTTFTFRVSVPNPYPASTYHFFVDLNVYSDSAESQLTYENLVQVNLVAQ
jgi:hypothetical protein